jgi:KUP system potassium uptake protein
MATHTQRRGALVLGALGIVFGDIGTSPLYTLQTVFSGRGAHTVPVNETAVYGVVSLVFWTIMVIVTIKYVLLIMSADNDGEGGIMALIALLGRVTEKGTRGRVVGILAALGVFGVSLFLGDSMITPAISVLSAVEGLQVVNPGLDQFVVPITAAILVALFSVQRFGTHVVGRMFGPVMVLWFLVIAFWGGREVIHHPEILKAVAPWYGVTFFVDDGTTAFLSLASVVLAVTGAEALYADMGHFGRNPIRRAWLMVVLPALTLTYFGQGALLLHDPGAASNPFFLLVPHGARVPMVVLATFATVIASQSVISGAFSVARQAVQLGYLPRLRIVHTSREEIGQVYVPWINWMLLAAVLTLVFAFGSSAKLASAYGVAVTGTITITTLLFFAVARLRWHRPAWMVATAASAFLVVDLAFLTANLTKLPHGGWLPLLVGIGAFIVLTTWQDGRRLITERRERAEGPLRDFIDELHERQPPLTRVAGTGVYLNRGDRTTPLAMRATVEHLRTLHEHVVIATIETEMRPYVPEEERLVISDLGFRDDGISHISARFGFLDDPHVPAVLRAANEAGLECPLEVDEASYFLSKIELELSDEPGMARWRKRIFLATAHLASDPVDYFALPRPRTLLMGSLIEV